MYIEVGDDDDDDDDDYDNNDNISTINTGLPSRPVGTEFKPLLYTYIYIHIHIYDGRYHIYT
jgi:hypothetical protein